MQTGLEVGDGVITGTLHEVTTGALATDWGPGYFMVLKFANNDPNVTSIKVGLDPSVSSGLVEIIGDPDMNGVFKVTDKDEQVFKVVYSDGYTSNSLTYDLSQLQLS